MRHKISYLFLFGAPMLNNNIAAASFWDMEPYQARDLINKKIFSIESKKPEVRNTQDITIPSRLLKKFTVFCVGEQSVLRV